MRRFNDTIVEWIDEYTGETCSFNKVSNYVDGSVMTDAKAEAPVYKKVGNEFFKRTDFLNAKNFGAKGDFKISQNLGTDDTIAVQEYIDFCITAGLDIYFPPGIFRITSPLNINTQQSITLKGAGQDITVFYYDSVADSTMLNFASNFQGFHEIGGFTLRRVDSVTMNCSAMLFNKMSHVKLRDIRIFRFNIAVRFLDTLIYVFSDSTIHYCNKGVMGSMGTVSPNNLAKYNRVNFNSNNDTVVDNSACHNIEFNACGFEANVVPLTSAIVKLSFNGTNGNVGSIFKNCYFEGNSASADVELTSLQGTVSHLIETCTFNRLSNDFYTLSNIKLKTSNPVSESELTLIANGFFTIPAYTSDAATRPTLAFEAPTGFCGFKITEIGNSFTNNVDKFVIPANFRLLSFKTVAKSFGRVGYDAYTLTATNGYNIGLLERFGIGVYKINFARSLANSPIASLTPIGAGCSIFVTVDTADYLQIQVTDFSGTPIDSSFSFIIL